MIGALCALGDEGKSRAEKLLQGQEYFVIDGSGRLLIQPAETLKVVARVPSITSLQLASSKLTDDELKPLGKMSQLKTLVLPEITSDDGLRHIAGLNQLRSLQHQSTYHGNEIGTITDAGMPHLSGLTNLTMLTLWSKLQQDGLQHLSGMNQLQKLTLHGVNDEALA